MFCLSAPFANAHRCHRFQCSVWNPRSPSWPDLGFASEPQLSTTIHTVGRYFCASVISKFYMGPGGCFSCRRYELLGMPNPSQPRIPFISHLGDNHLQLSPDPLKSTPSRPSMFLHTNCQQCHLYQIVVTNRPGAISLVDAPHPFERHKYQLG